MRLLLQSESNPGCRRAHPGYATLFPPCELISHIAAKPVPGRSWAFYKLRKNGILQVICPTCQSFRGIAHASDSQATLHGVVFDISGARVASALRLGARAVARGRACLHPGQLRGVSFGWQPSLATGERAGARTHDPVIKITGSHSCTLEQPAAIGWVHEHPVVLPHVSHFMHVPFRTSVKFPHSPHISPS